MRRVIALCHTVSDVEALTCAWEAQRSQSWELSVILPRENGPDAEARRRAASASSITATDSPIESALRLAAESEIAWILRDGRTPEAGSLAVIDHWFEHRDVELAYGDSMVEGVGVRTRPRYGRIRSLSTGDLGDSCVLRGSAVQRMLDSRSSAPHSWHEALMAAVDAATAVEHIPVVLDAGRAHPPMTARALAALISPTHPGGMLSADGRHVIPRERLTDESISIIIPSIGSPADFEGVERPALLACLESILARGTSLIEQIVIVAGERMPPAVVEAARQLAGPLLTVVHIEGAFNFSASCNLGAAQSTASHLLFLNDDVEAVTDGWLEAMAGLAVRPGVGAVGARLLFPDGRLQHCGITVRPDTCEPNHLYYGLAPRDVSDPSARECSEFLAVTGACLLVSRADFESVGGFSLGLPVNYNDVDLCLKLKAAGKSSVSCNPVTLIHRESTSRIPTIAPEEQRAMEMWRGVVQDDPYWYAWS